MLRFSALLRAHRKQLRTLLPQRRLIAHAWGNADVGQLGIPPNLLHDEPETFGRNVPMPQSIPSLQHVTVRDLSVSAAHSAFVGVDGSLFVCGFGQDGQLGLSTFENHAVPCRVQSVSAVRQVACGNRHTIVLCQDGAVFTFGCNRYGQLGISHMNRAPKRVNYPHHVQILSDIDCRITSVAAGDDFSVAVDQKGRIYTWGSTANGRLAHPDALVQPSILSFLLAKSHRAQHTPRIVPALKDVKVDHVFCGKHHATAVCPGGRSYSWGSGRHFQLGLTRPDDQYEPVLSSHSLNVKKIAHGATHTLILTTGGTIYAVGENERGCLGIGTSASSRVVVEPVRIPDLVGVVDIAAGWRISAAVVGEGKGTPGKVFMWGCGEAGALGNGEQIDHWRPYDIGLRARKVFIGSSGTSVFALS
ncbi:secretion-regulating guanine nucleotide exchange factor [Gracilaria domingensis]|nr:secretion-regulating guanine nucleotide exchange factor [Gracilaria domingensis]